MTSNACYDTNVEIKSKVGLMMVKNYKEILYDNETLETERLILRKAKKSDTLDMLEYASDEDNIRYLDWTGAKTRDEILLNIIDFCWANPGIWAIEIKETKKCIGTIHLNVISEHDKAEFGYVLNREYWNKGYTTEALSALIRLCFTELDINRVEAMHYVGNEGSGRVMQKCGLRFEGISTQARKVKGIFQDVVRYGMTKDIWISFQNNLS